MVTAVVAAFALVVVGVLLVAVRYLNLRSGSADRGDPRAGSTVIWRRSRRASPRPSTGSSRPGARGRSSSPRSTSTHSSRRSSPRRRRAPAPMRSSSGSSGPGGRPVVASFGDGVDAELARADASTPRTGGRSAPRRWTGPTRRSTMPRRPPFVPPSLRRSTSSGEAPGAVAVFSRSHDAFRAEQAGTLRALVEEAGVALANARRFADVEARAFLDPASGVPDRRGYELELERAVARARRTGQPFTVAIVALDDGVRADRAKRGRRAGPPGRARDPRYRRLRAGAADGELAILLPETRESEASRLTARLREEAQRALGRSGQTTFAVGLAEWRPNESVEALDARAAAALPGRSSAVAAGSRRGALLRGGRLAPRTHGRDETVARRRRRGARAPDGRAAGPRRIPDGRRPRRHRPRRRRRPSRPRGCGRRARRARATARPRRRRRIRPPHRAERRLRSCSPARGDDAEALLGDAADRARAAGRTRRARAQRRRDRDRGGRRRRRVRLARAEHALWQAKQAGPGTVVVALAAPNAPDSA